MKTFPTEKIFVLTNENRNRLYWILFHHVFTERGSPSPEGGDIEDVKPTSIRLDCVSVK